MIKYIKGNALFPVSEPAALIHVCNNVGKFGAGFAEAIGKQFPNVKKIFLSRKSWPLGVNVYVKQTEVLTIVNMVAQNGLPSKTNLKPADLNALKTCLVNLKTVLPKDTSIHLPRICTGYGGRTWEEVEPILTEVLGDIDVYVYDYEK